MNTPRPPDTTERKDDLKQRYLRASFDENLQPGDRVRQAALAHAQMVAAGAPTSAAPNQAAVTAITAPQPKPIAANRWNFSLIASVAIAGIGTLLAFQFDRSDPEDKAVVMGTPSVTAPPAPSLPASMQAPTSQTAESSVAPPGKAPLATRGEAADTVASKTTAAPPAAKTLPQANKESAKAAPAEALARPAAAPSTTTVGQNSQSDARADTNADVLAGSGPARDATQAATQSAPQSAPLFARSKSAPMADAKSASSADAESSAPSDSQQRGAQTDPLSSAGKSRMAPADALSANALALHQAARRGQIAELDRLLQLTGTALVNTPDDQGRTALMLATLGGHISLVQRLVSAGADASLKDAEGKTAGQMAQQLVAPEISNILNKQPASQ